MSFLIRALTISLLFSSIALSKSETYYEPTYLTHFEQIFDQRSVLNSDEYQHASTTEKENLLANHFKSQKAWAIADAAKWYTTLSVTALTIGYFSGLHRWIKPPTTAGGAAATFSSTIFAIAFFSKGIELVSTWIKDFTYNTATSIYQYTFGLASDSLEVYELRYVRKKPQLPPAYQHAIETTIWNARTKTNDNSAESDLAEKIIDTVLSLPTQLKDTQYNRRHIDELFNCYSNQTQTNLRRLIVRHVAGQKKSSQRQAIFFKGPPGTGKTRAARLVADALLVPYQEISLADVQKEDFVGSRETPAKPGLMLEAMVKTGKINNFVLLIDEADRVLNKDDSQKSAGLPNFMLLFLDPSRRSYYSEFLKIDIDISDITIILAGNYDIKDEALRNRLHVVPFDEISQTCKREIVWKEYFPEILSRYQESKFQFKAEDFTEEDRQHFDQIISSDVDPGMRSIYQRLEHYIEDLIIDKIEQHLAQ